MVDLSRTHRCYELAGRRVVQDGGVLVHGAVKSLRHPEPVDHAWVEVIDYVYQVDGHWLQGDGVWDPVIEVTHSRETFERIFEPRVDARYTQVQVNAIVFIVQHWGPWRLGEMPGWVAEQLAASNVCPPI